MSSSSPGAFAPTVISSQQCLATAAQASAFLSVSRSTLWRLERAGQLSGVRIGRALRFRWDDLQRLVAGGAA